MSTPRWLELLFTLCGLCICSWFYIAAVPANHEYPCFTVCFTVRFSVRFTAFHSAARVSLHPTALREFHFLFAVSWVGGAAIMLGKRIEA